MQLLQAQRSAPKSAEPDIQYCVVAGCEAALHSEVASAQKTDTGQCSIGPVTGTDAVNQDPRASRPQERTAMRAGAVRPEAQYRGVPA